MKTYIAEGFSLLSMAAPVGQNQETALSRLAKASRPGVRKFNLEDNAVLILDQAIIGRIHDAASLLLGREHWYIPGKSLLAPGDLPHHCLMIGRYRAVFSYTLHKGRFFRHLSVSVNIKGRFPPPPVGIAIAEAYGFTGAKKDGEAFVGVGDDWNVSLVDEDNCVAIVQDIPKP